MRDHQAIACGAAVVSCDRASCDDLPACVPHDPRLGRAASRGARRACLSRSGLYWHRSVHRSDATGQAVLARARKREKGRLAGGWCGVLRLGRRRHLPLCLRAFVSSARVWTMFWADGLRGRRTGLDDWFGFWRGPVVTPAPALARGDSALRCARRWAETFALPWGLSMSCFRTLRAVAQLTYSAVWPSYLTYIPSRDLVYPLCSCSLHFPCVQQDIQFISRM
ncbi:hypothetical protein C8Q73DRAFT_147104 [Cubamyces lactineus]|nr:hypothetical protein C8Q73DRAFT_147104 [Cubamyces lactineus]